MEEFDRSYIPKDGSDIKFVSHEGVFLNSKVLFIEFDDVIKSPFFTLLFMCTELESLDKVFDLDDIKDKDIKELYLWYIEREDKNIFKSLGPRDGVIESMFEGDEQKFVNFCDSLYYEHFNKDPLIINEGGWLNFDLVLRTLLGEKRSTDLVGKIIVWHPVDNEFIRKLVNERYGSKVLFEYGPLLEVLDKHEVTEESTFVFSDIYHIADLIDSDRIQGSSIIIADEYFYNYDEKFEPLLDVEKLSEDYFFRLDFFNNVYERVEDLKPEDV